MLEHPLLGGRHNGDVPRLNAASSEMPKGAERVHRALSTTTRLEVVRYLLQHPGSYIGAIIEGTALARPTVKHTLTDLESIGYVRVDYYVPGQRERQALAYRVNRAQLAKDLGEYQAYIFGSTTPATD